MLKDYGSSPRVRGTHHSPPCVRLPLRFIPARAGNTCRSRSPGGKSPVHPRACGEHFLACNHETGSTRFIPARAGNTKPAVAVYDLYAVHPRACGEHPGTSPMPGFSAGSSPRVRGTRDYGAPTIRKRRFIPARAGNTELKRLVRLPAPVHPRACGEHRLSSPAVPTPRGSSPRVRGTPSGQEAGS